MWGSVFGQVGNHAVGLMGLDEAFLVTSSREDY
jgi:hypothetical protein